MLVELRVLSFDTKNFLPTIRYVLNVHTYPIKSCSHSLLVSCNYNICSREPLSYPNPTNAPSYSGRIFTAGPIGTTLPLIAFVYPSLYYNP
jgi:hypothetical protein